MKMQPELRGYIHKNFNLLSENLSALRDGTALKQLREKYKYFCIFGYGHLGMITYKRLQSHGIKVDYFCDNNSNASGGKCFSGELIDSERISFERLCQIKEDCLVFVSPSNGLSPNNDIINKQLKDAGIDHVIHDSIWLCISTLFWHVDEIEEDYFVNKVEEMIVLAEDEESAQIIEAVVRRGLHDWYDFELANPFDSLYNPTQYFPDFVKPRTDECFVDGGAFTGDTFDAFYTWCGGRFSHYYGFELDQENFEKLERHINSYPVSPGRISLFPYGIYQSSKRITTKKIGAFGIITEDRGGELEVVDLDTCLKGQAVSFLKMDVEDSEVPALRGAREIISAQKPLCAISMYHSLQQFLEIPGLLKSMNPGYKLKYRCHTTVGHDIVCYAIDGKYYKRNEV